MDSNLSKYFTFFDYIIFAIMLFISALIGVYFAFFAKTKQNTTKEYLMGGKTMGIFPVSMSLIASYISGITILGVPAEMYIYGTQLWIQILPEIFSTLTMSYFFLPVFYELQITSTYEYLKLRFNSRVRLFGSIIFVVKILLYIPIVIYVPALAFSQVTGFNLHLITPITCIICIFYTTLGGMKAVVWTDTIQVLVMYGASLVVMVLGTIKVGGFGTVIERNQQSDRLEFFNFDLDPTVRHTFWTVCIGSFVSWLSYCSVNQAMVQRCLSMPTLKMANKTALILAFGIIAIVSMSCYTGLVIYALFYDCDPITTKQINKPDQLLPYFVMNIAEWIPGLPGLFLSGVFSAALSTMSTGMNSVAGVIFEDMIKPNLSKNVTEKTASTIMKIIVVIFGTICVGLVFVVEKMGTLTQAAKSMSSITAGPLLGIFILGMFFPWANSSGAFIGGVFGLCLTAWISIGTQAAMAMGSIRNIPKPVSIDGCIENLYMQFNTTSPIIEQLNPPFFLYRVSYLYYVVIGMLFTISTGLFISFLTGFNDIHKMEKSLFSPIIRSCILTKKSEDGSLAMKKVTINSTKHESTTTDNDKVDKIKS